MKNNRSIIVASVIGILILFASLVTYALYMKASQNGKIAVQVSTVPSDATISLNDTPVTQGTVYLKPGNYNVKVTKNGFSDYANTLAIDKDNASILVGLNPQSEDAKNWASQHQGDYHQLEAEGGKASEKSGEAFREKNPIVEKLPYENFLFVVGYRSDPDDKTGNSIIVTIDATESYRQAAIRQITELGFNPADYKIEFNDYKDPFAS